MVKVLVRVEAVMKARDRNTKRLISIIIIIRKWRREGENWSSSRSNSNRYSEVVMTPYIPNYTELATSNGNLQAVKNLELRKSATE